MFTVRWPMARMYSIDELPRPPIGRAGWPWTVGSLGADMIGPCEDGAWPAISVVTPSFNQGQFLEETIRSVLLQSYPNLQYLLIDGGSTDASVQIIKRYDAHIDYWVSEPDLGQADALNKGFSLASGDILCFINSDDILHPNALREAAKMLTGSQQGVQPLWGAFAVEDFDGTSRVAYYQNRDLSIESWVRLTGAQLHQPGVFWSRTAFEQFAPFDVSYRFAFDRKAFMTLIANGIFPTIRDDFVAAGFRLHEASKTTTESVNGSGFEREFVRLSTEFLGSLSPTECELAINDLTYRQLHMRFGSLAEPIAFPRFLFGVAAVIYGFPRALRSRFLWGMVRKRLSLA